MNRHRRTGGTTGLVLDPLLQNFIYNNGVLPLPVPKETTIVSAVGDLVVVVAAKQTEVV